MLNEPVGEGQGGGGGPVGPAGAGGAEQGQQYIQISPEERAAIDSVRILILTSYWIKQAYTGSFTSCSACF